MMHSAMPPTVRISRRGWLRSVRTAYMSTGKSLRLGHHLDLGPQASPDAAEDLIEVRPRDRQAVVPQTDGRPLGTLGPAEEPDHVPGQLDRPAGIVLARAGDAVHPGVDMDDGPDAGE